MVRRWLLFRRYCWARSNHPWIRVCGFPWASCSCHSIPLKVMDSCCDPFWCHGWHCMLFCHSTEIFGWLRWCIRCWYHFVYKNMRLYWFLLQIFASHAIGGLVGNILTALFAQASIAGSDGYTLIDGGWLDHWYALHGDERESVKHAKQGSSASGKTLNT